MGCCDYIKVNFPIEYRETVQSHRMGIYKKQPQVFNSFPVWQKVLPGEEGYEDVGGVAAAAENKLENNNNEDLNSTATVKDVQYIFYVAKYNLWLVGKDIGRARGGLFWKGIHYESKGFKRNFFCPATPEIKPTELKVFFNKKWNNVGADANIVSCKSK